jgi:hypothetical protein
MIVDQQVVTQHRRKVLEREWRFRIERESSRVGTRHQDVRIDGADRGEPEAQSGREQNTAIRQRHERIEGVRTQSTSFYEQ